MELTDDEIKLISHYRFRKLVNDYVEKEANKYLGLKAANHPNLQGIVKIEKKKESYLSDKRFSIGEAQLLFQLRTRMMSVKSNYSSIWKDDVACRFCKETLQIESQTHLLACEEILNYVDTI